MKKNIKITLIIIILVVGMMLYITLLYISGLSIHNSDSCIRTASDANQIKSAIADYYAIPTRNFPVTMEELCESNSSLERLKNNATITFLDEHGKKVTELQGKLKTVIIRVTDPDCKCPPDVQKHFQEWDNCVYSLKYEW